MSLTNTGRESAAGSGRARSRRRGGRLPRWTRRGRGEMCTTGRRVPPSVGSVGREGSCGSCSRRSGVRGGAVRPGCGQRPRPGFRWRGGRLARRTHRRAVAVPVTRAGATSGTTPRLRPDRSTRAAASGSLGAAQTNLHDAPSSQVRAGGRVSDVLQASASTSPTAARCLAVASSEKPCRRLLCDAPTRGFSRPHRPCSSLLRAWRPDRVWRRRRDNREV